MGRFTFLCALYVGAFVTLASAEGAGCSPGYFITGSGSCKKCPKGTYQPGADKYGCLPCEDGQVSMEDGSTECVSCAENEAPNEQRTMCECIVGAISKRRDPTCTLCEPGTYYFKRRGKGKCFSCSEGFYQPESGKTSCIRCPQGSSSRSGATECTTCSENELVLDGDVCGTCPAGETKSRYGNYCEECEDATFKGDEGIHPCEFCPPGEQPNSGKTACMPMTCPTGEALLKKGKKMRCGKCPAGSYYDGYDMKCLKCSRNYYMPFENVGSSCYSCPEKEFTLKKGAAECSRCPQGQRILESGECGTCPAGYEHDSYRSRCSPCGINTYSNENMDYCASCPNRLYSLPKASRCFSCPPGQAVLRETGECGVCPAGRYYDEYDGKCDKCYEGSFKSSPGIEDGCDSCPEGTVSNKKRTACIPE